LTTLLIGAGQWSPGSIPRASKQSKNLTSILFHAEFYDVFAQVHYFVITTHVVEGLFGKEIVVADLATGSLFCQQAGLRLIAKSIQDA
jgi:hypothetical protein